MGGPRHGVLRGGESRGASGEGRMWIAHQPRAAVCIGDLDALVYLHCLAVLHRDLSLDNVMLTTLDHCKLTDFGLSTRSEAVTRLVGKPCYMAPEILSRPSHGVSSEEVYGPPADVFSFGVLVLFMFGGCTDVSTDSSFSSLPAGQAAPLRLCFDAVRPPESLEALVKLTTAHNPADRPSAEELRGADFFQTVDWAELQETCKRDAEICSR